MHPSVSNHSHLVILTDDQRTKTLACEARAYPGHPHIVWLPSEISFTVTVTTKYSGVDGANYLTSKALVQGIGTYQCLLKQSTDERTFTVVGKGLILRLSVVTFV